MRRIGLAVVLGLGLVFAPVSAWAQPTTKVPRIGVVLTLYSSPEGAPQGFNDGLRELGYIEGQNVVVEWRSVAGKYDQLGAVVTDLVRLKVDVIVADVTRAVLAAKQATTTIPIVFTIAADPVGNGLVSSLAHPGGNVTGCSILLSDISAKRLQLLTEAVPSVSRAAVLWNPHTPYHKTLLKEVEAAAPSLRLRPVPIAVQDPGEFERAFASMRKAHVNALFVADDPVFAISRTLLLGLAAKDRLPTIFANRDDVTAGGLMSYGPRWSERFRTAATYVDKILKGAKPADLPVDQAVKLELVINLKTAKALGLTIPQTLLRRADLVIE
jgi:putative tryptophan/tyrosine transport system substrate-binding protein